MKKKLTGEERKEAAEVARKRRRDLLDTEKALTAEKRAEVLAASGALRTVDGAGLSPKNQVLVYLQASAAGFIPSLVGGFEQWWDNGRIVKKGAHGLLICFPKMRKDEETGEDELAGFGWGYVFDISQTTARRGEEEETEQEQEQGTEQREEVREEVREEAQAEMEEKEPEQVAANTGAGALDDIFAAIAAA